MKIEYGAEVVDRNGRALGTVNRVMRDVWTGGVRKFMVRQEETNNDFFFSPEDVLEESGQKVKLRGILDASGEKLEP
jgi:sporulation protein YlmC with PRC-barrel domain